MIKSFQVFLQDKNNKRLLGNFLSLIVLKGFQFLIPLVTLPYLIKTIGVEKYGLVNFSLSLGMYFGAIIQFGFGVTATRELARNRNDTLKVSQIYSSTLSATVLLALCSAILFTCIVFSFEKFYSYLNLYLYTLAFIIFQSLFPIWFFQGMEKMKYITFLSIGTSAMFLGGLFSFVELEEDFVLVPLLNAVAAFVTLLIAIVLINKKFGVRFFLPKSKEIKEKYKNGYNAFVSQLAPNLYNNSCVFLLGAFTNNTIVGLYTAATKVIDAVIAVGYILSNSFFPYLSRNLDNHKLFKKVMLLSGLVLTVLTWFFSEWISKLIFSSIALEVAVYIEYLAICIFLLFSTMTYGTNYLMLIGKDKVVKNIAFYTSIVFFSIAVFIIPVFGGEGAILTLVVARLVIALLQFVFYLKYRQVGY